MHRPAVDSLHIARVVGDFPVVEHTPPADNCLVVESFLVVERCLVVESFPVVEGFRAEEIARAVDKGRLAATATDWVDHRHHSLELQQHDTTVLNSRI